MSKHKLFIPLPHGIGKEVRVEFRVSKEDCEKIKKSAAARQMSVAEFLRRAALGRPAPLDIDTDLVLGLSDAVRSIRALHKAYLERGFVPPEDLLRPVLEKAGIAMHRIIDHK